MTNSSKKQIHTFLRNCQDTDVFSLLEMKELRTVFKLNSYEPEPLFINGRYLYV